VVEATQTVSPVGFVVVYSFVIPLSHIQNGLSLSRRNISLCPSSFNVTYSLSNNITTALFLAFMSTSQPLLLDSTSQTIIFLFD
jgi:hypothetical protein